MCWFLSVVIRSATTDQLRESNIRKGSATRLQSLDCDRYLHCFSVNNFFKVVGTQSSLAYLPSGSDNVTLLFSPGSTLRVQKDCDMLLLQIFNDSSLLKILWNKNNITWRWHPVKLMTYYRHVSL